MAKTKKTDKGNGQPKGKKQAELDGFERPSIPEIDTAALGYVEARDARMKAGEIEQDRKAILTQQMNEHLDALERDDKDQPVYVFRDGTLEHTVRMVASDIKPKVESKDLDAE